jgi:hypothetical protein
MESVAYYYEPGIWYVVLDLAGEVVYEGTGLSAAAILLDPGTFLGKGPSPDGALIKARHTWIAYRCAALGAAAA